MADLAAIFHWPPDAMRGLSLGELIDWQQRAVRRFNLMHRRAE